MKAVLRREKARNRSYHKLASLTYIQRAEARPKTMPAPPPPPRAAKPARERAPWATWHRTSTGRAPRQFEAGGATPAPGTSGCRVRHGESSRNPSSF